MPDTDGGMTVKELLLRLEGKIDAFVVAHEHRHQLEAELADRMRGDPSASAAGRAMAARVDSLSKDMDELANMVRSHDRTLQRLIGASALLTTLGIGTLGLVIARIAGFAT